MDEEREKLIKKRKELETKETQLLHQLDKAEKRKQYLDNSARKQRSHRLITRGAAIESLIPEVRELSETDFYSAMEAFFTDEKNRTEFLKLTAMQEIADDKGEN